MSVNKTCTSISPLVIQSVLSTDSVPTSAAGYTSSVLNQVVLSNSEIILAAGSYVTISGRKGSPTGTSFGILIQATGSGGEAFNGATSGNISNMTVAYIEMYGPSCVMSASCSGNADGFNIAPGSNTVTAITLDHDYIHRWGEDIRTSNWNNCILQYSWIADTHNDGPEHEDLIYNYPNQNFTIRYNKFWGSPNDGIWEDDGGAGQYANWAFYGNVVYHSGGWFIGFPRCTSPCGPVFIYNNTFAGDGTFGDYQPGWIGPSGALSSGSEIANNIFYSTNNQFSPTGSDHNAYSNNVYSSGETGSFVFTPGSPLDSYTGFVNMSSSNPVAADYHLTSAGATIFQNGKPLPPPYNMDPDGNNRGANAQWYIGAYTFGAGSGPQPPSGLHVTVQ